MRELKWHIVDEDNNPLYWDNNESMRVKVRKKNPFRKYSYNTGLRNYHNNEPVWGIDNKWLMWEIKHGYGLKRI